MPKSTYHHLPEEKKEKIMEASYDEFAKKTYKESRIANIIKQSNIPRGSFYQYFENKMDLYRHVMLCMTQEKMNYFSNLLEDANKEGFFKTYEKMTQSGLKFAHDHPKYEVIGRNFFTESEEIKKAVMGEKMTSFLDIYVLLLEAGIQKKEIKSNIDVALWSYLIFKMQFAIGEYMMEKNRPMEEIAQKVKEMMEVLKNGLGFKEETR